MAGFIKFDGIANQNPQNITRAAAPRREAEASPVSPRDTKDTFSQSASLDKASLKLTSSALDKASPGLTSSALDKASPGLTNSAIDKASPGLRSSLDTSTPKLEGKIDILG